jgi:hypothetical protein
MSRRKEVSDKPSPLWGCAPVSLLLSAPPHQDGGGPGLTPESAGATVHQHGR